MTLRFVGLPPAIASGESRSISGRPAAGNSAAKRPHAFWVKAGIGVSSLGTNWSPSMRYSSTMAMVSSSTSPVVSSRGGLVATKASSVSVVVVRSVAASSTVLPHDAPRSSADNDTATPLRRNHEARRWRPAGPVKAFVLLMEFLSLCGPRR